MDSASIVQNFDVTAGKEPRFIRIMRQHLDFFAPDSQLLIMFIEIFITFYWPFRVYAE